MISLILQKYKGTLKSIQLEHKINTDQITCNNMYARLTSISTWTQKGEIQKLTR